MAAKIYYISTVRCNADSPFPLDMLRYDRAYPERQEDVSNIYSSIKRLEQNDISIYSDKPLTEGRWQSFGWSVVISNKRRM